MEELREVEEQRRELEALLAFPEAVNRTDIEAD